MSGGVEILKKPTKREEEALKILHKLGFKKLERVEYRHLALAGGWYGISGDNASFYAKSLAQLKRFAKAYEGEIVSVNSTDFSYAACRVGGIISNEEHDEHDEHAHVRGKECQDQIKNKEERQNNMAISKLKQHVYTVKMEAFRLRNIKEEKKDFKLRINVGYKVKADSPEEAIVEGYKKFERENL